MTQQPSAGPRSRNIVLGPLPPPVHGFSLAMEGLAMLLRRSGAEPLVFNLAAQGPLNGPAYHLQRMRRVIKAALTVAQERRLRGDPVRVHIGCDGGAGLLYTLLLTAAARIAGCSLYFHHHSYASLSRWRLLMFMLVVLGGRKAVHVALRQPMADALRKRYGERLKVAILSNAAFVTPAAPFPVAAPNQAAQFSIGMLGNLCEEKGLHLFLALADTLHAQGSDVRVILAGPIARNSDRAAVARRIADGALEWIRPVTGETKGPNFFRRIDLLVFPSLYTHEAEPIVLLEAMAHGGPIIATDRGCIRDLTGDAAVIVPAGVAFTDVALQVIWKARADRTWLQRKGANAWARFQRERHAALRQAGALLGIQIPDETTAEPALVTPMRGAPCPAHRSQASASAPCREQKSGG